MTNGTAWILIALLCMGTQFSAHCADAPAITPEQIAAISYDDAIDDTGRIAPLSLDLAKLDGDQRARFEQLLAKVLASAIANEKDTPQRVRNLLCLIALVDVSRSEFEGELAGAVIAKLLKDIEKPALIQAAAAVALHPDAGRAVLKAPELGYDWDNDEAMVRERSALYARKLLGRALGKLPPK